MGHRWKNGAKLALAGSVAVVAVAAADTARAQAIEEIVVTSNRQSAVNIQRAPAAISVINTANLEKAGAQGFADYLSTVPSAAMQETGPGQNKFVFRGLTTTQFNQTDVQDRTLVSVYLDDTPISLQGNTPDLAVFDLERIEVLRGPSGTLYGAGSMAGTIRLLTQKPDTTRFSGSAEAMLGAAPGHGFNYSVRGMVNAPLVEGKAALRVSAFRGENAGYIDNVGPVNKKDANSDERIQGRVALRLTPNDRLTVDATLTTSDMTTGGEPTTFTNLNGDFASNTPENYHDHFRLATLTFNYDLDWAKLTSTSSATQRQFGRRYSGQYLVQALALRNLPPDSTAIIAPNSIMNKLHDFDQEVRISSGPDSGRLKWIGGLFYQRQNRTQNQDIPTVNFDNLYAQRTGVFRSSLVYGAPTPDDPFYGRQNVQERQIAAFGEVTYEVLPKLELTGGLRYFDWKQKFNLYYGGVLGALGPNQPLRQVGNAAAKGANPRATASYRFSDDLMIFAEAAKGFRYGGVNQPVPETLCVAGAPISFGPDKLWSYSVGEKATLLNGRLTANVTAFLANWYDVQTQIVDKTCSYFYVVNGGKVQSKGLEFESRMRVTDQLSLTLNASYTDSRANGAIPSISVPDGARTPDTPRYIVSLAANYVVPLNNGDAINLQGDWQYRGNTVNSFNPDSIAYFGMPANNKVNLAVTYQADRWELGLFGRNVTNSTQVLSKGTLRRYPGLGISIGRPTDIGIRAKLNF